MRVFHLPQKVRRYRSTTCIHLNQWRASTESQSQVFLSAHRQINSTSITFGFFVCFGGQKGLWDAMEADVNWCSREMEGGFVFLHTHTKKKAEMKRNTHGEKKNAHLWAQRPLLRRTATSAWHVCHPFIPAGAISRKKKRSTNLQVLSYMHNCKCPVVSQQ